MKTCKTCGSKSAKNCYAEMGSCHFVESTITKRPDMSIIQLKDFLFKRAVSIHFSDTGAPTTVDLTYEELTNIISALDWYLKG